MFGTNDRELTGVHLDVEHAVHLHRFAIDVDGIRMGHDDAEVTGAERHHVGVLVEFARKQLESHPGDVHEGSTLDQGDIEKTVGHGCVGSDVGIVAPLRGVADGDEESLLLDAAIVGIDDVGGRFVVGHQVAEATEVGQSAARTRFGKLGGNLGVETHARRAEEDVAVDRPVIDLDAVAFANTFERLGEVERKLEVTGKAVAASHRDDAELDRRAYQRTARLVDGAVAADGYDRIETAFDSLLGQFTGMAGIFGETNLDREAVLGLHDLMHQLGDFVLRTDAGYGIYDDKNCSHSFNDNMPANGRTGPLRQHNRDAKIRIFSPTSRIFGQKLCLINEKWPKRASFYLQSVMWERLFGHDDRPLADVA